MKNFRYILALALSLLLLPLSSDAVVTTIVNDLSPSDPGSILEVSNIKGKLLPPNLKIIVRPGETKKLTIRNIHRFTVTRIFGDVNEKYVVSCPTDPRVKDKITLRLVDIRNNSMPAGCLLEKTGRWTRSDGVSWDAKPVTKRN